jgi:hypothetical protein
MAVYFLSLDLNTGRDYRELYEELDNLNAVRILESDWCLERYNTTPSELRDYFKSFLDNDEGLFVIEANNWATSNTFSTPNDLR